MFGLCAPSKGSPTQITPRDARPCAGPGIAWGSHGHRCTRRSVRVVRAGPVDPRCQAPPSGCRRFMGAVTGGGGCARPPATFWDPSRGRSCRGRAGVVRGGRFEIGEREGGAGWWPVEASLFGAEALGGTGPQGSRCAANPGHSTIVRSGHGWDLEQACQAVREHGEDQRHLELSEGRHKRWGRQVHSLQRVNLDAQTWRSVATRGLGDRRMSLQDMAGTGSVTWNGSWDAARPHGPCVRGEGGLWLDREPRVATRPHPPRADR